MAVHTDEQLWIDLEVEAWRGGDLQKWRGQVAVVRGARRKWREIGRRQNGGQTSIALANAISDYHAAWGNVDQARAAHHQVPVPDETDIAALTTYVQLLAHLISERLNLDRRLITLIQRRSAQRDFHRTVAYLENCQGANQNLLTANRATVQHYRDALDQLAQSAQRAEPQRSPNSVTRKRKRFGELGRSWVGPFFLGSGAYSDPKYGGGVHAFLKQDHDGMVVDRVVVKDTEVVRWFTTPSFKGPLEVAAMQRLRQLKDSSCIVRLRNWRARSRQSEPGMWIRIYMEYCAYGTLETLRKMYTYTEQSFPPEPYLWAIFDSLATAGLLMGRGEVSKPICDIWDPIIHGDLRLQNIMLGANDSGVFQGYRARAKVGDFGASFILKDLMGGSLDDQLNRKPGNGLSYGIANARPPEAKGPLRLPYEADGQLRLQEVTRAPSSATNVWGIGFVMWSMVSGLEIDTSLHDYRYAKPDENPDNDEETADANRAERERTYTPRDLRTLSPKRPYSDELLDLIMDCVQYEPATRPTLDEVLNRIRGHTGYRKQGHPEDRALGLRNAGEDDEGLEAFAVDTRDKWAVKGLLVDVLTEKDKDELGKLPHPPPASNDDDNTSDSDGVDGNTGINVRNVGASWPPRTGEEYEDDDDANASPDDGVPRKGATRTGAESSDVESENFSPSSPRGN